MWVDEKVLDIVLLAVTVFMVFRQLTLIGTLSGVISARGRANIMWSFWAHMVVTTGLVTATIIRHW